MRPLRSDLTMPPLSSVLAVPLSAVALTAALEDKTVLARAA